MAIIDTTKIDKLFKALFNRARTSAAKQFYEETIPTAVDVHASEIYLNPIPSAPPAANTGVVKLYTGGSTLVLTKDTSVANNLAWVVLPAWQSGWSSGSNDVSQIMKNFIAPKYGTGYTVKVFKGDGTRIPELDNVNWMFDYKAGVLTFESDPGQSGATVPTSIKIEVYQYVGQTAAAATTSSSIATLTDVDAATVTDKNILMYDGATSKWKNQALTSRPAVFEITVIATSGDRVIMASKSYSVGDNSLMVFMNGLLALPGASADYVETDANTITFNYDLALGDQIVLRIPAAGYAE